MNELRVENLRVSVGDQEIVRGLTLRVPRGEVHALMGPNGSGKSTLLHILGTLDQPTRGTVKLEDIDPFTLDEPRLAAFRLKGWPNRRQQISFGCSPKCRLRRLRQWPRAHKGPRRRDDIEIHDSRLWFIGRRATAGFGLG